MNQNDDINSRSAIASFLLAVHAGRESEVCTLIESGIDVNEADTEGITPLMAAAMNGNLGITRILLKAGARCEMVNKWGMNAYEIAKWRGFEILAAFLHKQEIDGSDK